MSKTTKDLTVFSDEQVTKDLSIKVETQDIISYKVAKFEEQMEIELEKFETKARELNKQINIQAEKKSVAVRDYMKKETDRIQAIVDKKFTALIPGMDVDPDSKLSIVVELAEREDGHVLVIKRSSGYSNSTMGTMPAKYPASAKKAVDKMIGLQKDMDVCDENIRDITRKLGNINKMERRAKARLIEQVAASNPAMKKLLAD